MHIFGSAIVLLINDAVTLRIPLLAAVFLVAFPWLAFHQLRSLFRGLFDQTPLSLFLVTLAAAALAGSVLKTGWLFFTRTGSYYPPALPLHRIPVSPGEQFGWLAGLIALTLPTLIGAFSVSRKSHSLAALLASVAAALAIAEAIAWGVLLIGNDPTLPPIAWAQGTPFGRWFLRHIAQNNPYGFADHFSALCACLATLGLWLSFGIYGYRSLGKVKTVPALASFILLVMMLTWVLGGLAFTLDMYHIPLLLIVVVYGIVTAATSPADHVYRLVPLEPVTSPSPADVLLATGQHDLIVVSAQGGGIQAAAWTAQVLQGLREACTPGAFDSALRMISSVSGGSVGSAFYLDKLLNDRDARNPVVSAADSSLDEVSWGMAWPDFLRGLFPWFFGWTIDRAQAMERAWSSNGALDPAKPRLKDPLSHWRREVTAGSKVPAVVMNSTVVENGMRVLLGTSAMERCLAPLARIDASALNRIGKTVMDVSVATAARLSASFTWVSPAARAEKDAHRPHLVDGGYYDDYGMATLVEWLDEALNGAVDRHIRPRVLVLQIHCSPVDGDEVDRQRREAVQQAGFSAADAASSRGTPDAGVEMPHGNRGWFFQLFAPIKTILSVRTAGQIAHNDIEFELLQAKWQLKGVEIETVRFVFPNKNAPLSWHLTEQEKQEIRDAWRDNMTVPIAEVAGFLGCECANSQAQRPLQAAG